MGRSTITKGIVEEEEAGNLVPFKIVVNTTSEDLLSESKTITLVDRMSADLRVNLDSIVVKGKDDQELTDIKVGYERTDEYTYIKFTIPDDQKVTITYDTVVTSAPGKTVTLSNDAYWEGYEPTESSSVSQQYSYNFEGVASADGYANLKLTKVDASDITKKLSGAEYSMQEVQVNSDGTYTLVGDAHTGTTDENGVIYFSNDDDATKRWMKFDTIYAITETKAPDGYYLDTTPHYIVLATQENTTDYPDKVEVVRNKSLYEFEASDKRMYALPKAGGMGVSKLQITGVLLLAMAAGYVSVRTLRNYRRRLNG
jgi:hypothetical protein